MSSIKSPINMKATQFSACGAGVAQWVLRSWEDAYLLCSAWVPHAEPFNFRLLREVPGLP